MVNTLNKLMFIFLCCASINCGVYGFRGNNPPEGINSLFVPVFEDISGFSAPTLADDFTQRLKVRILNDNTFRIAEKTLADGILKCIITGVRDEPVVISSGENVARRKITITVSADFMDLKKQKTIWNRVFENYGEYESSNDTFSARTEGFRVAVERITEDILIDLTSNW